jgi:hypothetical protein
MIFASASEAVSRTVLPIKLWSNEVESAQLLYPEEQIPVAKERMSSPKNTEDMPSTKGYMALR